VRFEHGAVHGTRGAAGGDNDSGGDDEAADATRRREGTSDVIDGEDVGWFLALSREPAGPKHVMCLNSHEVEHCNEGVGFCTPEEYSDLDRYRLS